jgi:hypothetical protein
LKHVISIKDFRHYTPKQLKERAKEHLLKEAMEAILKYQVVTMHENEQNTTFNLEMVLYTPHQWKGIVSVLNDIKAAIECQKDPKPDLMRLCDALRV